MKKSFLIPCVYQHVESLKNISKLLDMSSVKPDEVIIHISSCPEKFEHQFLQDLFSNNEYAFEYEVTDEFRDAGINRNNLAKSATGDLLIFQDADDFFHPQRIEFIEKSFQEEDIIHLVHSYYFNQKTLEQISFQNIDFDFKKIYPLDMYHELVFLDGKCDYKKSANYGNFDNNKKIRSNLEYPIHNGAISIRKEVVEKIKWKTKQEPRIIAEDQDFNFECFYHFNKSFILLEKIYYYNLAERTNGGF